MSINEIIVYLMVVFMALGAVDRILGNRFGLGEKFEEGIMAMGSLALAMIGIICLAPVLANLLRPVVVPLYQALGADPAMFAGTLLANDMGGAPLAQELALTQEAGQFGGLIVGSMLKGMQSGVAAVIASVVYDMGSKVVKEKDWVNIVIMGISFIASYFFKVNVVLIIVVVACIGAVRTLMKERKGVKA